MKQNPINPYETPQAELLLAGGQTDGPVIRAGKLYTPNQVKVGTFLCGPMAAVWFLKSNFDAMQSPEQAQRAVKWGIAACCLVLGIMLVLPENFPRIILPLAYSYPAGYLVESYQLKKAAILESDRYTIQSNWLVAGVGVISLIVFFLIAVGLLFSLNAMGVLHLA